MTTTIEADLHTELREVRTDLFRVDVDGRPVGFVEIVGHVHVGLIGAKYAKAVEVAQKHDPASAAHAVVAASHLTPIGAPGR